MKLEAVGYRLLVKLDNFEEVKKSGLIVASDKEKRRQEIGMEKGTVVDVGPFAYKELEGKPWVKKGDRVLFQKYEGVLIEDGEDRFRALNDLDIYAVIIEE